MKFGSLGELIKYRREEKGWTQEELAERVGLSRESIREAEKNRSKLRIEVVERIVKILKIQTREVENVCERYKECQKRDSVSNLLKFYRIKAGLSQAGLADKVGISFSTISMYENGDNKPRFIIFREICKVLGIPKEEANKVYPRYNNLQEITSVGDLFRKYRLESGLSQEKVGKKVGVSYMTIFAYEKNERKLRFENVEKLRKFFKIPFVELTKYYNYYEERKKYERGRRIIGLGLLLGVYREKRGRNKKELCKKLGISPTTLLGYERNRYKPRYFEILEKIVLELDIPEKELERADKSYYKQYLKHKKSEEKHYSGLVEAVEEYFEYLKK